MQSLTETVAPQISVDAVKKSIDAHENVILLDVRTKGEYSRARIEDSINVPLDDVVNKIESDLPDKSAKIYVYCLSGSRSIYAVEEMIRLGYPNIFNVTNGLLAWRAKKYPVSL